MVPRLTIAASLLLLVTSFIASGQTPGKVYQLGVLANSVPVAQLAGSNPQNESAQALRDELRKLGWVEGKNLRIHWRSAEDRYDRRPVLIKELLAVPVDVLLVSDSFAAGDALKLTKSVPIVAIGLGGDALVSSVARPGGNLTGMLAVANRDYVGKSLSLLKETAPTISTVAMLIPWFASADLDDWPEATEPARALGLRVFTQRFESIGGIEAAIDSAAGRGANALLIDGWQPFFLREHQLRVQRAAERHRLPALYIHQGSSDNGGLITRSVGVAARYGRAAYFVDRILKGEKPGDIPVELPTKYELVINLKAAKAIGLAVPAAALMQADRIIQ